jgi:hypothetical protein
MEVSMFFSRFLFSRTPVVAGLVVAGLLWAAGPASAQQASYAPYGGVSKFDRANAGAALPGAYYAPKALALPAVARTHVVLPPSAVGSLTVTVRYPESSEPVYVTLRGPDGEVQRYALENGSESIQTKTVIVRRGEAASFRFALAAAPK